MSRDRPTPLCDRVVMAKTSPEGVNADGALTNDLARWPLPQEDNIYSSNNNMAENQPQHQQQQQQQLKKLKKHSSDRKSSFNIFGRFDKKSKMPEANEENGQGVAERYPKRYFSQQNLSMVPPEETSSGGQEGGRVGAQKFLWRITSGSKSQSNQDLPNSTGVYSSSAESRRREAAEPGPHSGSTKQNGRSDTDDRTWNGQNGDARVRYTSWSGVENEAKLSDSPPSQFVRARHTSRFRFNSSGHNPPAGGKCLGEYRPMLNTHPEETSSAVNHSTISGQNSPDGVHSFGQISLRGSNSSAQHSPRGVRSISEVDRRSGSSWDSNKTQNDDGHIHAANELRGNHVTRSSTNDRSVSYSTSDLNRLVNEPVGRGRYLPMSEYNLQRTSTSSIPNGRDASQRSESLQNHQQKQQQQRREKQSPGSWNQDPFPESAEEVSFRPPYDANDDLQNEIQHLKQIFSIKQLTQDFYGDRTSLPIHTRSSSASSSRSETTNGRQEFDSRPDSATVAHSNSDLCRRMSRGFPSAATKVNGHWDNNRSMSTSYLDDSRNDVEFMSFEAERQVQTQPICGDQSFPVGGGGGGGERESGKSVSLKSRIGVERLASEERRPESKERHERTASLDSGYTNCSDFDPVSVSFSEPRRSFSVFDDLVFSEPEIGALGGRNGGEATKQVADYGTSRRMRGNEGTPASSSSASLLKQVQQNSVVGHLQKLTVIKEQVGQGERCSDERNPFPASVTSKNGLKATPEVVATCGSNLRIPCPEDAADATEHLRSNSICSEIASNTLPHRLTQNDGTASQRIRFSDRRNSQNSLDEIHRVMMDAHCKWLASQNDTNCESPPSISTPRKFTKHDGDYTSAFRSITRDPKCMSCDPICISPPELAPRTRLQNCRRHNDSVCPGFDPGVDQYANQLRLEARRLSRSGSSLCCRSPSQKRDRGSADEERSPAAEAGDKVDEGGQPSVTENDEVFNSSTEDATDIPSFSGRCGRNWTRSRDEPLRRSDANIEPPSFRTLPIRSGSSFCHLFGEPEAASNVSIRPNFDLSRLTTAPPGGRPTRRLSSTSADDDTYASTSSLSGPSGSRPSDRASIASSPTDRHLSEPWFRPIDFRQWSLIRNRTLGDADSQSSVDRKSSAYLRGPVSGELVHDLEGFLDDNDESEREERNDEESFRSLSSILCRHLFDSDAELCSALKPPSVRASGDFVRRLFDGRTPTFDPEKEFQSVSVLRASGSLESPPSVPLELRKPDSFLLTLKEELLMLAEKRLQRQTQTKKRISDGQIESALLETKVTETVRERSDNKQVDKYLSYLEQLEKVIHLLINLSVRLSTVETSLCQLHPHDGSFEKDKKRLCDKRRQILDRLKEATDLKRSIDARGRQVSLMLSESLQEDEYKNYKDMVKKKCHLTIQMQVLEDGKESALLQRKILKDRCASKQETSSLTLPTSDLLPVIENREAVIEVLPRTIVVGN